MSKTRRALKNTAIQAASQLVTWTLSWILLVILPRKLGDANFGKLFFALSYGMIFSQLINLGVNTFLVREVAVLHPASDLPETENSRRRNALRALISNVFTLKVVLAFVVYALQSALIFVLPYDAATRTAVLIIGLGTCVGAVGQTLSGVFQGLENMLGPNIAVILEKAIVTGGCWLLLALGCDLRAVCWAHTAATVLSFALQLGWLRRIERFAFAWDYVLIRRVCLGGLPFLIWVIFGEIYVRIDVLMLSLMTSDAVVGWYGAATRLYGTLLFIPTIMMSSVFPAMMRLGAGGQDEAAFGRASERLMNLLLFSGVPVAAGTIAVAAPLVKLLYGVGPFAQAAPNLQVLGGSILLVSIDIILGTALIARGKEKPWACMAIAAAFFNPLLNLWAIPYAQLHGGNGGVGAAWATLLTEVLMMLGAFWLMPKGVFSRRNLLCGAKAIALGTAMVLLLRWWGTQNIFLIIAAGGAFYVPLALLVGVVPREDLAHIFHALFKHRGGAA